MNPLEQKYIRDILEKEELSYYFDGGNEQAERKVLVVGEIYEDPFKVIQLDNLNASVKHPDILGTLMSLSLERKDIGDIVFGPNQAEFTLIPSKVKNVLYHLDKVKNIPVKAKVKDEAILLEPIVRDKLFTTSIASMRLDCMVASMSNTSRSKAQDIIKSGRVKLNFIQEKDQQAKLSEGDYISIGGLGRFKILEEKGKSRKNRIFVDYIKKE